MRNKPSNKLDSKITGTLLDMNIVRLHSSHAKQAVTTLVRAFQNQQPFQHYFPDKTERERVTPYLISMAVFPGFQYGEVHATSYQMEGISIWMPSETYPVSPWRILRSVPLSVTLGFARYGSYRLRDFGQYIDAVHARLAPFRHIYLQSLGVDPDFQGKGHAGRLLRHMVARMDAAGLPAYLETLEEQNVRLYEHFGFTVVDKSIIPGTNLTNWAMLREAR